MNAEGDVHINASLQGIGEDSCSLSFFFCPWKASQESCSNQRQSRATSLADAPIVLMALHGANFLSLPTGFDGLMSCLGSQDVSVEQPILIMYLRSSGYFLAGGIAGIVSRTATAPLDRLKVYLIAQTSNKEAAIDAAKSGSAVRAARHLGRPLIDATKDLWAGGGIRNLFAGKSLPSVWHIISMTLCRQRIECR